jgi:hypothetical protein
MIQQQKMMAGQQMQRDPSNMDMGGQGPQTPGTTIDNAPSPSKRPRLDNGGFEGAPMPGRQPMAQMTMTANGPQMIQNGMGAPQMNAFGPGANGPLKMEVCITSYAKKQSCANEATQGMNGMPPNMAQAAGMDGGEFPGQPMGNNVDNKHALQDYQMQLMLLEQQNKKRLLAAKRDNPEPISGAAGLGGAAPPGGFQQAPTMSPSGSRGAGPSPTPNDQMRKVAGTPKLAQQVPGSPMTGIENRASPAPNFDPTNPQMAHNMPQQFYANMNGNPMARPPSSHPGFQMNMTPQQMEQMQRMNAGRGQQPWPPNAQQMMPNMTSQQAAMAAAQQRQGTMAPPPVPAAEQNIPQQRAQPSSPATTPAPPTPSTKAAAKPKKEAAASKKKNQTKKNAAAATPVADSAEPTPTPSTPISNAQFGKQGASAGPTNAQSQPPAASAQSAMDGSGPGIFATMDDGSLSNVSSRLVHDPTASTDSHQPSGGFSLDFQSLDGSDVFENFDFDNFLNQDGADNMMESISFPGDGVEAGANV